MVSRAALIGTGSTLGLNSDDLKLYSGLKINVPSCFIAGRHDWGIYQKPGALDEMQTGCSDYRGCHLIDAAGHWVQQEQPEAVSNVLLQFLEDVN